MSSVELQYKKIDKLLRLIFMNSLQPQIACINRNFHVKLAWSPVNLLANASRRPLAFRVNNIHYLLKQKKNKRIPRSFFYEIRMRLCSFSDR